MPFQCLSDWHGTSSLSRLRDLSDPPKKLYYLGRFHPKIFSSCVAIVGSRRFTDYGRRVIDMIIPRVVSEKKTVVSGFMYGADQYAHEACVKSGGKTVAVLGWGIAEPLAGEDKRLGDLIISSGGLIVSEWEKQKGSLWTFPVRNRIVAALCDEVIVVEADRKSGSLITANLAYKLGRKLWAVPGPITSRYSSGTNELIAEGKAGLWQGDAGMQIKISDDPLVRAIGDEAMSADELARAVGQPVAAIGAKLSMMTITGQVVERGGKYYVGKN